MIVNASLLGPFFLVAICFNLLGIFLIEGCNPFVASLLK